ncbi:MAG: twin arginine-targeting protein translocase TatB [Deltaproteobacteria bacterium RBG_16_44_11]|nr:MAG: twin arginine-targeting protein translocase TatB [Deltaproteobacteria bacterium RBG_16_44_11]
MFGIGMQELIIIAIIALLIVGPKKLPDLAKTLGKSFGELRRAADDMTDDFKKTMKDNEKQSDDGLKDSLLLKKTEDEETKPENFESKKEKSEPSENLP